MSFLTILAPKLSAQYSSQEDPTVSWGGYLSDAHAEYVAHAKEFVVTKDSTQPLRGQEMTGSQDLRDENGSSSSR